MNWLDFLIGCCVGSLFGIIFCSVQDIRSVGRKGMETDGHVIYKCLLCKNERKLKVHKKDYCEVKVCPNCLGVSVDVFKIAKYKQVGEKE